MGSAHRFSADVRLMAGSSRFLLTKIEEGRFRPDLFYYFLSPYDVQIAPEAVEVMMNYLWPGSVEELKNGVEQAINSCENNRIELRDLPRNVLKAVATGGRKYKFTPPAKA